MMKMLRFKKDKENRRKYDLRCKKSFWISKRDRWHYI